MIRRGWEMELCLSNCEMHSSNGNLEKDQSEWRGKSDASMMTRGSLLPQEQNISQQHGGIVSRAFVLLPSGKKKRPRKFGPEDKKESPNGCGDPTLEGVTTRCQFDTSRCDSLPCSAANVLTRMSELRFATNECSLTVGALYPWGQWGAVIVFCE